MRKTPTDGTTGIEKLVENESTLIDPEKESSE
jgi:hypothetical protein